jgi:PIN domain nuclease of toxin-antitoxin system
VIVLDTHAWIWWVDDPKQLSVRARRAIDDADVIGVPVISCWEAARLAARGRIDFHRDADLWINQALHVPKVELLDLTPRIGITAAFLEWTHGDPADRLIVSTGITLNAPVVSKDAHIRMFRPARAIW